jgi:hypothetical protein
MLNDVSERKGKARRKAEADGEMERRVRRR